MIGKFAPKEKLYRVSVEGGDLAQAGARKVIFHGVNKSGSLSIADVMFEAYKRAGRQAEFVSTYHNRPRAFDAFVDAMGKHEGPGFFVSHYIYNGVPRPEGSLLVTQFRHPVPRMFSIHGWLKRNYIRRNGSEEGYPTFKDWIVRTKGMRSMQMWQFAVGFSPEGKSLKVKMKPQDMLRAAIENVERDVAWHGVAELFEESIYAMAHFCGIQAVPAWKRDTRNIWRTPLAEVEPETIALAQEVCRWDMELYDYAVAKFRHRIAGMAIGGDFAEYRKACANEYKERLIS